MMDKIISSQCCHFDFRDRKNYWVRNWEMSLGENKKLKTRFHTLSAGRWSNLEDRCSSTTNTSSRRNDRIVCINNFSDFQDFASWSSDQYGYEKLEIFNSKYKSWHLDKDLLVPGNIIYSPERCLFLPNRVNCFLHTGAKGRKGIYPVGVYPARRQFAAQMNINGKKVYLGLAKTPLEAHRIWQVNKIKQGNIILNDFPEHTKLQEGLSSWIGRIKLEFENYKESFKGEKDE